MEFRKVEKKMRFLDSFNEFQEGERITEIRWDPLTGRSARIVYFPVPLPGKSDLSEIIEFSQAIGCPFCPDKFERMVPKFLPAIAPEGRITKGAAVVFPNAFPYDEHSAVAIFSSRHFVALNDFQLEEIKSGFMASQEYLRRVAHADPAARWSSINWNYMPLSGGSLVHPHLQIISSDLHTNFHGDLMARSAEYYTKHQSSFWRDLLAAEQKAEERYLGSVGNCHFLMSYVPKGLMDFMMIFPEHNDLRELQPEDWEAFCQGLLKIFAYLDDLNLWSFNVALYSGYPGSEKHFTVHGRLVPRITLPPLNTSEVNYFKMLHDEFLTIRKPEEVCAELKARFTVP